MDEPNRALADFAESRRATLTTLDARDGRPRSVPICFVLLDGVLYSPIDDKPKANADPARLRRVRNLEADPRATILIDRWSEDWRELGFVEVRCDGSLIEAGTPKHARAVTALRAKYPQYASHRLEERPLLAFRPVAVTAWSGGLPHVRMAAERVD